jgi:hypothetical protein
LYQTAFGINVDSKEGERRKGDQKTMNIILKGKVEFNPQKDLMGKTIERYRINHHQVAGLRGI